MFNITNLIQTGGLFLIAAVIFGESGMMVGFLFPGDTLLLSAGVLAAGHKLSLVQALIVIALAAIIGDNVGYQIGKSLGPRLFTKEDGVVFRKQHIDRAKEFYGKYGSRTMLLAHFVPVIRAFAPVTAGAADMSRKQFFFYDAIGDIAWTVALTLFGYFVGSKVPGVDKYIEPILVAVIIIFLAPTLFHIMRDEKIRKAIFQRRSMKRKAKD
jgi:membrane-associated protein